MSTKKTDDAELWEKQGYETSKQFEAFQLYRDMGFERSLRAVAKSLNKSLTLIARWSGANNWVDRVAAWDAEQDRLNRIQQQKEIAKMRKKHADLARSMINKAILALNSLDVTTMTPSDIARFAAEASKIERISRGDVGEVVEERDGGKTESMVTFYMPDNSRD